MYNKLELMGCRTERWCGGKNTELNTKYKVLEDWKRHKSPRHEGTWYLEKEC